jgi:hypothetical protein
MFQEAIFIKSLKRSLLLACNSYAELSPRLPTGAATGGKLGYVNVKILYNVANNADLQTMSSIR